MGTRAQPTGRQYPIFPGQPASGIFGNQMKAARTRALKRIGTQAVIERNQTTGFIERNIRKVYIPGYHQGRL